jgi:RNA polymerase sigma-70 factor (ECF subfamily)
MPEPGEPLAPEPVAVAIGAERRYLLRFAMAKLRDAELAEDLVQETLLAALQGADGFEQRAALRTWLTGILLRRIADQARRRQRRPEVDLDAPDDDDDDESDDVEPVDWIDPPRRLEGRQVLDAVSRALVSISPTAARLVTLREVDGFSHEDAARELGLEPQKAASVLHRARIQLRERLGALAIRPRGFAGAAARP